MVCSLCGHQSRDVFEGLIEQNVCEHCYRKLQKENEELKVKISIYEKEIELLKMCAVKDRKGW